MTAQLELTKSDLPIVAKPSVATRNTLRSGPFDPATARWLRAQRVNLERHAAGLGPFAKDAFGSGPGAPSPGHLAAVNQFLGGMQHELARYSKLFARLNATGSVSPDATLDRALLIRGRAQQLTNSTEKVWDFYFRTFSQRRTHLGPLLHGADRIALDCYQACFMGLGVSRSIPAPPPFSYMHGERGAATFRRGVTMSLLGRKANPFPLIKLPYHRLMNAWTLGAIPHEVAHNLQSDLGMWTVVPQRLGRRLRRVGLEATSIQTWMRWHKEIFADLCGVLLIGPAYTASLIEVVSRTRHAAGRWHHDAAHPTPLLRPLISAELVNRLGFAANAKSTLAVWKRLYPGRQTHRIPKAFISSFPRAVRLVVDEICFRPYKELGGRTLSSVISFGHKEYAFTREAAGRLASGTDPGVVPERYLIGAARVALDERLAAPATINKNFYLALNGR